MCVAVDYVLEVKGECDASRGGVWCVGCGKKLERAQILRLVQTERPAEAVGGGENGE